MSNKYIHGYTVEEQQRLIEQAKYWKQNLILPSLDPSENDSLIEIGCGVGAVLGEIGKAFPGLNLAGIDIQTEQIEYANQYLKRLNLNNADLRVGDAAHLPWPDQSFNLAYSMWMLEHVCDQEAILKEAYRVLKPGGSITLNETDYKTLLIWPDSPEYYYLQDSFCELFYQSGGHPHIGRLLEPLLYSVGFHDIKVIPIALYYSRSSEKGQGLRQFVDYVSSFIEPTIEQMVKDLGKDKKKLKAGLEALKKTSNCLDGIATVVVYQASARR